MTATRIEKDSMGTMEVPEDVLYGAQTARAVANFPVSGMRFPRAFIRALGLIKKNAAITNAELNLLAPAVAAAIEKAAAEVVGGDLDNHFVVDIFQTGSGTSTNMNANEVIANRAIEILGGEKGDYGIVNPNDHVNRAQSTNDVIPTAAKLTTVKLLRKALFQLERLEKTLADKELEFHDVIKMGRTQMQDAVPIRLGAEFGAYRKAIQRDIARLKHAKEEMYPINLGGTAIGTMLNANHDYVLALAPKLAEISGIPVVMAEDLVDGTQNLDSFAYVSASLKTCAISCSKIANDLRLMSSGPRCGFQEINLPAMQAGSSIMPGKVNPVIPEVMSQVAFGIIGNDIAITMAAEAGQLELNYAEPVLYHKLFESIVTLTGALKTFTDNCVSGITADEERCRELVEGSVGVITAICPAIGYNLSAEIAKTAIDTGGSVRAVLKSKGIFTDEEIETLLDPRKMV